MQSYTEIASSTTVKTSLVPLLANDKTVMSCNSGTAFPTANLQQGMLCFRTDLNQLYELQDLTPTWKLIADLTKTYLTQESADLRYYRNNQTLDTIQPPAANLNLNNRRITSLLDPQSAQDAATKNYVDSVAQGLDVKASVRVLSAANVTVSNPGITAIDGVTLNNGDRVLLVGQTTASENGIYQWNGSAVAMTRTTDADTSAQVTAGLFTWVTEGTTYTDSGWILTTKNPITLGTTNLAFSQFSGAAQITAGTGLSKTGNTISLALTSALVTGALGYTPANSANAWTTSNLVNVSQLSNNSGYITAGYGGGVWTVGNLTAVSQLSNNMGYLQSNGINLTSAGYGIAIDKITNGLVSSGVVNQGTTNCACSC
jgi:hypothetical protein